MKIIEQIPIYTTFLPKNVYGMTIFKWVFINDDCSWMDGSWVYANMMRHEGIHMQQMLDLFPIQTKSNIDLFLGGILFYLWYVIEWLLKVIICLFTGFKYKPYRSISFEQEANKGEEHLGYIGKRKRFEWLKYVFKLVK